MIAKKLETLIKKGGWFFVRQNGSHKIYKHRAIKGIVVIPFHGKKRSSNRNFKIDNKESRNLVI